MSQWTHAICDPCWGSLFPGRVPCRLLAENGDGYDREQCCWCGSVTDGIYTRRDPSEVCCRGTGGIHDGGE
jgi:hypothetical protein